MAAFERIRDWVEGRMGPEEAARFARELERDAELAVLAARCREVWALTAAADAPPPACRLEWATLEARLDADASSNASSNAGSNTASDAASDAASKAASKAASDAADELGNGRALDAGDGLRVVDGEAPLEAPPRGVRAPRPTSEQAERDASWRRIAAAAGLLVLLGGALAWWAVRPSGAPEVVVLRALASTEPPAREPVALPAALGNWRPVADETVQWISTLEEGRDIALATGRPLLVFGSFPTCPWCIEMRREALVDPGVLRLVEAFVPVNVDFATAPEALSKELLARGYPFFEVQDAGGEPLHNFSGRREAADMREHLERGLAEVSAIPRPLGWDVVAELARVAAAARAHEAEGRVGAAYAEYEDLTTRGGSPLFRAAGEAGLERLERAARTALRAALAERELERCEAALERAVARFAGTPWGEDLARVLRALRASDALPHLVWARG